MKKKLLMVALLAMILPVASVVAFHPTTSCDRCHLPHNGGGLDGMPLWNGETITEIESFDKYTSHTLDAVPGEPAGPTLVCLACHDGSDPNGRHSINNNSGGDLSGTHPMEFVYDAAQALDNELHLSSEPSNVIGGKGTIADDLLQAGTGNVNCQSCHEIHVNGLHEALGVRHDDADPNISFDMDIPHLVPMDGIEFKLGRRADPNLEESYSLSYGQLCVTCHIK